MFVTATCVSANSVSIVVELIHLLLLFTSLSGKNTSHVLIIHYSLQTYSPAHLHNNTDTLLLDTKPPPTPPTSQYQGKSGQTSHPARQMAGLGWVIGVVYFFSICRFVIFWFCHFTNNEMPLSSHCKHMPVYWSEVCGSWLFVLLSEERGERWEVRCW